jgi:mediator of RNA polymerase II transcription subunit 31
MEASSFPFAPAAAAAPSPDAAAERRRFTLELEFVQLLGNPAYVAWLAQEGYLGHPPFLAWLRHLRATWTRPAYARHLLWPAALTLLALLCDDAGFRAAAGRPDWAAHVAGRLAAAAAVGGGGASAPAAGQSAAAAPGGSR